MRKRCRWLLGGGFILVSTLGGTLAQADDAASALLKEVDMATRAAKTLTADLTMTMSAQGHNVTVQGMVVLKKPNMALIDTTGAPFDLVLDSDGKSLWIMIKSANQYQKRAANPQGRDIRVGWAIPVQMFFDPEDLDPIRSNEAKAHLLAPETVDGKPFQVVELTGDNPFAYTMKLYAGPEKLVTRVMLDIPQADAKAQYSAVLSKVQVGANVPDTLFAYQPPKTTKAYVPSSEARLVAVGKEAPRFMIPSPSGGNVALADALKDKKAVLINFWFYANSACKKVFPQLQRLYTELRSKGLEVIAVDNSDPKDVVKKYVADNRYNFLVGLGNKTATQSTDVPSLYGVTDYPTNYIVDSTGKVVWRSVGFNEATIRGVLARMGVQ